jgi:transposase
MPISILNKHFRLLIVERILKGLSYREVAKQLNISNSEGYKIFLYFKKYGYIPLKFNKVFRKSFERKNRLIYLGIII